MSTDSPKIKALNQIIALLAITANGVIAYVMFIRMPGFDRLVSGLSAKLPLVMECLLYSYWVVGAFAVLASVLVVWAERKFSAEKCAIVNSCSLAMSLLIFMWIQFAVIQPVIEMSKQLS